MSPHLKILVVGDDAGVRRLLGSFLGQRLTGAAPAVCA